MVFDSGSGVCIRVQCSVDKRFVTRETVACDHRVAACFSIFGMGLAVCVSAGAEFRELPRRHRIALIARRVSAYQTTQSGSHGSLCR